MEALTIDSKMDVMMDRHRGCVQAGKLGAQYRSLVRRCSSYHSGLSARADKFDAKLREGVWLGLDNRSDENIIGTRYGVYRASTIKGVPEDKR